MTIIVTGGAGFIGSNFIFYMLDKHPEDRIVCVDKLTYAGNLSTLESVMDKPNFRFVKADICDRKAIYDLFEEEHPDMVVNFAAESHVDRSIESPEVFLQTNILGTQVMLDACRKYGMLRPGLHPMRPLRAHHRHRPLLVSAGQRRSLLCRLLLYHREQPHPRLLLQALPHLLRRRPTLLRRGAGNR